MYCFDEFVYSFVVFDENGWVVLSKSLYIRLSINNFCACFFQIGSLSLSCRFSVFPEVVIFVAIGFVLFVGAISFLKVQSVSRFIFNRSESRRVHVVLEHIPTLQLKTNNNLDQHLVVCTTPGVFFYF